MHFLILVHRVAIGRADPGGALMRAGAVANTGVHHDMGFYFAAALVSVANQAQTFG